MSTQSDERWADELLDRIVRPRVGGLSGRVFWAAIAAVMAAALLAGLLAYRQVAILPNEEAEIVQASASPGGRWEVRTFFVDEDGLGSRPGVLRVDVRDLRASPPQGRTVYVLEARNEDLAGRVIRWIDGDTVLIVDDRGDAVRIEAPTAHGVVAPAEFRGMLRGAAAGLGVALAIIAGGTLGVLLVANWARRRDPLEKLPAGMRW